MDARTLVRRSSTLGSEHAFVENGGRCHAARLLTAVRFDSFTNCVYPLSSKLAAANKLCKQTRRNDAAKLECLASRARRWLYEQMRTNGATSYRLEGYVYLSYLLGWWGKSRCVQGVCSGRQLPPYGTVDRTVALNWTVGARIRATLTVRREGRADDCEARRYDAMVQRYG